MIKPKTMELIRKSKTTKAKLQLALDKSAVTIQRYIDNNDIILTTVVALEAISEGLEIDVNQILDSKK